MSVPEAWPAKAIDALPEGIVIIDAAGRVLEINAAAATILGVARDGLFARSLFDICGSQKPFATLVELVEAGLKAETMVELEGGRQILAQIRRLNGDGASAPQGTLVILHDLQVLDHEREKAQGAGKRPAFRMMGRRSTTPDLAHQRRLSPYLNQIITLGERAMRQSARVLLLGESGVGKTEIARYLHAYGSPPPAPFVHVNCGSIPDTLFESEMFGYERGAFTGALSQGKKGLIEAADGGTLFLDEVGEIPLAMQAKLLKFLETGSVQRVGGSAEKSVKVRIMAATNRKLDEMVRAGHFRRDLYYRLAVVPLHVRSLSESPELVGELIDHFVAGVNQQRDQPLLISEDCRKHLLAYSYPGNIRELQNIIQQISVVATAKADAGHLPEAVLTRHAAMPGYFDDGGTLKSRVRAYERQIIEAAIGRLGSKRKAAEALGVDIGTIVRKTQEKN